MKKNTSWRLVKICSLWIIIPQTSLGTILKSPCPSVDETLSDQLNLLTSIVGLWPCLINNFCYSEPMFIFNFITMLKHIFRLDLTNTLVGPLDFIAVTITAQGKWGKHVSLWLTDLVTFNSINLINTWICVFRNNCGSQCISLYPGWPCSMAVAVANANHLWRLKKECR